MFTYNNSSIFNICTKCWEKADLVLHQYEVRDSPLKIHLFDDIYLKYTNFRTLHNIFFTNDLLRKCKVVDTNMLSLCST